MMQAQNFANINCSACQNLYPVDLTNRPSGHLATIFTSLAALKASIASTACESCVLIHETLAPEYERQNLSWDDAEGPLELRVEMGKSLRVLDRGSCSYMEILSENNNSQLPNIGPTLYKVEENSSSIRCHEQVKSWLEDCVQTHSHCRTQSNSPLPTRVIDVGLIANDTSTFRQPYLWESEGVPGTYVALSYCWGVNPNVVTTTSANFEAHKKCLDMNKLPKTIRDAITITRNLSIPYLWVDALCIIQKDTEDWARESGKMCQVYSNAELTISASSASASSEGIFGLQKYGLPPRALQYRGHTLYTRVNTNREHNRYTMQMCVLDAPPINRRAWTFQEATLSNRVIHYTGRELVWECNEYFLCECGFSNTCIEADDDVSSRGIRQPELARGTTLKEAYARWRDLVRAFSERQLTVDDDRLSAMSGLAKQYFQYLKAVSPDTDTQYVAGLWTGDLCHQLLWSIEDDWYRTTRDATFQFRRPKSWRAPSWSWAAVEAPIQIDPLSRLKSQIEIVKAEAIPKTIHDNFGQVVSAKLVLKGRLVNDISIISEKTKDKERRNHVKGILYRIKCGEVMHDILPDDPEGPPLSDTYSCFLVGDIDMFGPIKRLFLVLRPSGVITGDYERVGVSCLGHAFGTTGNNPQADFPIFDRASQVTICIV